MDYNLMKQLSEVSGIPSEETKVANLMRAEFEKRGLKVKIDRFGNVLAYKKITKDPLMLGAHMDEIGLIVKHIDDTGFIRFFKIGGIDDRTLVNQHILIKTNSGSVYGLIGSKPPHVMKTDETKKTIEYGSLFVDVGAKNKKEVEKMGIQVGTPMSFPTEFRRLGKNRMMGKALDNRIGCYVLIELAKNLPDNVLLVGTTQEEISTFGKGAAIAAYHNDPSAFIAVDTCVAGDHPEVKIEDAPIYLEKGPALVLFEWGGRGNIADKTLVLDFINVAKKNKIPFQLEAMEGGATDAASVYNLRGGIPSVAVCVPTRYIHSTVSLASEFDITKTIELLRAFLKNHK